MRSYCKKQRLELIDTNLKVPEKKYTPGLLPLMHMVHNNSWAWLDLRKGSRSGRFQDSVFVLAHQQLMMSHHDHMHGLNMMM